jgi:coronin-1B/1C/6
VGLEPSGREHRVRDRKRPFFGFFLCFGFVFELVWFRYWAAIWEAQGGGAVVAKTHKDVGKGTANPPLISGHKAAVLDLEFSPFNPYILATASEDCMVKIWVLPEGGVKVFLLFFFSFCFLSDNFFFFFFFFTQQQAEIKEESQLLKGHKRKVGTVAWHPTANNVLATSGADFVIKVWDVETGASKLDTEGHGNIIQSTKWSFDGAQMVTACKDKKLRMFDPRQPEAIQEWHGHDGVKGPRAIFCGKTGFICSAGTSKVNDKTKKKFGFF